MFTLTETPTHAELILDRPPVNALTFDMIAAITGMTAALISHPAPVVAAINGHALGGGFVLMLCADYRVCTNADGLGLGLTEAAAGVPFPAGPIEVIKAELPPATLRQLTLSSQLLPALTARRMHIIDEIVDAPSLVNSGRERLAHLNAQPAFAAVKRQIRGPLADKLAALVDR